MRRSTGIAHPVKRDPGKQTVKNVVSSHIQRWNNVARMREVVYSHRMRWQQVVNSRMREVVLA